MSRDSAGRSSGDEGNESKSENAEYHAPNHGALLSSLDGRSLALPRDPEPIDGEPFDVDTDVDPAETFPQSVASGDPTPTGVVLWTRVEPTVFDPDVPLGVEVASDEHFDDVVFRGLVRDGDAVEANDYTITVDLDVELDSDRHYWYRFVYDGVRSRTGRCRTLPAPDADPESVSFGVLTCQNYLNGYYGAYHHVAEEDVDFLLHVGDFIYESATGAFTGLDSPDLPDRTLSLPSDEDRATTLDDYRSLYRTVKSDRLLQAALERHTLIPAWDDHEIANDVYWDQSVDAPRADHPRGDDPAFMTRLVADALHAWWEYMPARIDYDPEATSLHERFQLWRTFSFGDLVDVILTDERLFRDAPRKNGLVPTERAVDPEEEDPDRTMLGEAQLSWFLDRIRRSEARWTVWCDEVLTMPLRVGAGRASVYPVQGGWDGYTRERRYIASKLHEWDVENFVTLTGDMHCYLAGYQQTEYADPLRRLLFGETVDPEKRVGVEFMTPPVTSLNIAEAVGVSRGRLRDPTEQFLRRAIPAMNPHIHFFDSHSWGYSVVEFTREACTYTGYSVDKTVDAADAEKSTVVKLRVPNGRVQLERIEPAIERS